MANYDGAVDHLQQAAILAQVSRPRREEQWLARPAGAYHVAARRIKVGENVAGRFAAGRLTRGGFRHPQARRIECDDLAQRGFFDEEHNVTGATPNDIELHPVIYIKFL